MEKPPRPRASSTAPNTKKTHTPGSKTTSTENNRRAPQVFKASARLQRRRRGSGGNYAEMASSVMLP